MAKHRNNPNMAFWKMIKEGYDHFEVTHQEPKVDFCEKKYVFDAGRAPNATRDPVFQAAAKCPAYAVPEDVADAVREKQQQDEAEYAKLVARGTPVAKLNTGIDGGMNEVFAAHVQNGNTGLSDGGEGQGLALVAFKPAPGTIPGHVNPPRASWQQDEPVVAAPAQAQQGTKVAVASAAPESEGFFSSLARKVGLSNASADTTASTTPQPAKPKIAEAKPQSKAFKPAAPKQVETRQAAARPPFKPAAAEQQPAPVVDAQAAPPRDSMVTGSQPIVSANSFESRFSAMK
jgi:hypothetical protein